MNWPPGWEPWEDDSDGDDLAVISVVPAECDYCAAPAAFLYHDNELFACDQCLARTGGPDD